MLKLYKKLKPLDWVLTFLIIGFTVLQVYCTMTMVDYVSGIIKAISYLNYHNNPSLLGDTIYQAFTSIFGGDWANVTTSSLAALGITGSNADMILAVANASTEQIWFNGGMMILLALSTAVIQAIISVIASYVAADLSTSIRSQVYEKVSSFSLKEIHSFSTASLITRTTNDIQQVQMANLMMMRMIFAAPITAIWAICKIQASSTQLTIATAIAVVLLLVIVMSIILIAMPKFTSMQKLIDKLNGVTRENLTGIRVVRAYNAEKYQEDKFEQANDRLTKTQIFTGEVTALMSPAMTLIMNGLSLTIYWIGATLMNKAEIEYSTVTSFSVLASQIIMAFMMLMLMFVLWPRAMVSAKRINEVLETEPSVVDASSSVEPTEKGTIVFDDVCFRYPEGKEDVLSHISFTAKKGQTIAFIGATGSGKSSLINLTMRFYDRTSGKILVDGVDVKDLSQEKLHSLFGYVPQKGVLFSGTVKENIALGLKDLTDEEAKKAADVAEADEFVSKMEGGYQATIAQGGKNVSGGQKQRLCIARAVALNPEFFVFDDSFSALDYKTDRKVRENLNEYAHDATKLIVAQRIGTIMDADTIVVLENGKAVGIGTHKELLNNCPTYRSIALSQLSKEELGL
ncbi:MAG: ABC transporter ATP-binding protein/permease [Bacilli bacterium]|jgi:ATP-binding cassette subfamily B protein|nr:ABC transporter ATP-binding protein/permease [Bacilli bacterium]MCH4228634.1 ABC transporter ATP-binding protein/permease [Bacilli bacterium]MCH4278417.1 ABC transporter ATP-binding protein/permease [Bacilli bacterium]MCI2054738.1 ABC transporter ATP-binding protein/permease [Bacilli bacterium]